MSRHLVTFLGHPCPQGEDAAHHAKSANDPEAITFRGVTFPLGVAVPLDAATPAGQALIAKLRANGHFRVEAAPEHGVAAQPGTPETDADPRNPNLPEPPHPAQTPEAVAKREARAAKKAAKQ